MVVFVVVAVAFAAVVYIAGHFAISSDTQELLSPHLKYIERAQVFDVLFHTKGDQIVIVIDGKTPELAAGAEASLAEKLSSRPDMFRQVQRPDAGFFAREGLLFLSLADVKSQMAQLISAQPFLGPLAEDPSLRGLMTTLATALQGVSAGQAGLSDLNRPITSLAASLDDLRAGRPAYFSWGELIAGKTSAPASRQRIITVLPVLNFAALESGAGATAYVRQSAQALGLDPAHGVRVRLTGSIPLQDERFGSLTHGVALIALMALAAILLMLWLAVRSPRLMAAILITMLIGLTATMAVGLMIFRRFNVISVAFIPL
ncbi:MAG TPA: MMPL family transporter, partial [Caulobacteraceae bacterium]